MICTRGKLLPTHALRRLTLFPNYSIIKPTSCTVAFCAKERKCWLLEPQQLPDVKQLCTCMPRLTD